MDDFSQRAKQIVSEIIYMTLATVGSDGHPWNSPVFCAYDATYNFYWSSSPQSQHSRNIAHNTSVFIVIYNSQAGEGEGDGVYIQAVAEELTDPQEITTALTLLGERRGAPFLHPEKFAGDGPQRIYKATPQRVWINDADKDDDGDFIKDYRREVFLTLQTL